jgi:hypothetical protein
MMNGMTDWMGGMGLGWLLVVIVLVLVGAAALKYLLSNNRKDR